jgi:ribosomal-protein-alanine N-acetyltransferase
MPSSFRAVVREATSADIENIVALGQSAETSVRWNRSHYLDALSSAPISRLFLVAEREGSQKGVVGFIVARFVSDECEIENVVVSPENREKGLGHLLVHSIIATARHSRAVRLLLEVRASNAAAIALYKKGGFQQDGLRKNYYSHPVEDALLFSLSLYKSS